jgi:hypothetical protein
MLPVWAGSLKWGATTGERGGQGRVLRWGEEAP